MALVSRTVERYDRSQIKEAVLAALDDFGGLETLLADKKKIVLKTNFVIPESQETCATTHPDFYMAIAELLQESGRHVTIGESPAFGSTQMAVRFHGVLGECRRKGIDVLTFTKPRMYEGLSDFKAYAQLTIAAELEQFDALINLPKLKVHQQFVFSGATKNLYGCVTGKRKAFRHFQSDNRLDIFARMIHLNAAQAKPVLNIGDGILALHKHGPRGGEPFPLHRIIVSDSCFEHDWLFARMIGLDPATTPLFAIMDTSQHAALEKATRHIKDFPETEGWEQSKITPIEFSFFHMIRSVWKSLRSR